MDVPTFCYSEISTVDCTFPSPIYSSLTPSLSCVTFTLLFGLHTQSTTFPCFSILPCILQHAENFNFFFEITNGMLRVRGLQRGQCRGKVLYIHIFMYILEITRSSLILSRCLTPFIQHQTLVVFVTVFC